MRVLTKEQIPKDVVDVPLDNLMQIYKICKSMHEVCLNDNGIGLAAVQVGIPWRLCVIKKPDDTFTNLINATYYAEGNDIKITSVEGCLSLRSKKGNLRYFEVLRWPKVKVVGMELTINKGQLELVKFDNIVDGLYSFVYQHEIDHAKSTLISDIGIEISVSAIKTGKQNAK